MHPSFAKSAKAAIPLHAVSSIDLKGWLKRRAARDAAFLKAAGFAADSGDLRIVPNAKGGVAMAVLGLGKGEDALALAAFSEQLPEGVYRFESVPGRFGGETGALAWLLGTYAFSRYRKTKRSEARLVLEKGVDGEEITRIAENLF